MLMGKTHNKTREKKRNLRTFAGAYTHICRWNFSLWYVCVSVSHSLTKYNLNSMCIIIIASYSMAMHAMKMISYSLYVCNYVW